MSLTVTDILASKEVAILEALITSLKPRQSSTVGFIGDTEDLAALDAEDKAILKVQKITCEQIGTKIKGLIDKVIVLSHARPYVHPTESRYLIEGIFEIQMISMYRGLQDCPFQKLCEKSCHIWDSCMNFKILNRRNGKSLNFVGGLLHHLICDHHFFEGKSSPYRLDPAACIEVLELKEEQDYAIAYEFKKEFSSYGSSFGCSKSDLDAFIEKCRAKSIKEAASPCAKVIAFLESSDEGYDLVHICFNEGASTLIDLSLLGIEAFEDLSRYLSYSRLSYHTYKSVIRKKPILSAEDRFL